MVAPKMIVDTPEYKEYVTNTLDYLRREGVPQHLIDSFVAEVEARPGEFPRFSRDIVETYPDERSWTAMCRTFEHGVLHWTWADGTGFTERPKE